MNPADEIKALKEKRDALESQLVVGTSEAREIAIRNQIVAIGQEITGWIARLPPVAPAETRTVGQVFHVKGTILGVGRRVGMRREIFRAAAAHCAFYDPSLQPTHRATLSLMPALGYLDHSLAEATLKELHVPNKEEAKNALVFSLMFKSEENAMRFGLAVEEEVSGKALVEIVTFTQTMTTWGGALQHVKLSDYKHGKNFGDSPTETSERSFSSPVLACGTIALNQAVTKSTFGSGFERMHIIPKEACDAEGQDVRIAEHKNRDYNLLAGTGDFHRCVFDGLSGYTTHTANVPCVAFRVDRVEGRSVNLQCVVRFPQDRDPVMSALRVTEVSADGTPIVCVAVEDVTQFTECIAWRYHKTVAAWKSVDEGKWREGAKWWE